MNHLGDYDVIVIGAGHAGIEAAHAAAVLGAKTAVFTMSLDAIGNMPCNPSIGGTAKGTLVREVDALGGVMGLAADATYLQSRMLNKGKGPAVHALRVQTDRRRYNEYMKTHSDSNDPGNTPDQNTDGDRDLVCLALRVTDEESANALLDTLASNNATATFLFSEEQLSSLGDLLRRVVISGNAAALRIDASGGSSRTVSAIERANNALWAACNEKARLVALYGASDKTLRAVRAAGYCPIDFDLDYSGGLPTAAQAASSIARQARSGGCIAYLGADTAVQADWSTLLSRLRSSSRLITALNELAVTKDA